MTEESLARPRFQRDYYTLYLYLLSVVCGIHQAILGSVLPFLRDELTLSKLAIGWHFSLYAIGMFASGFIITWLVPRSSPRRVLLLSAWAVVLVVALFALHLPVAGTLSLSLLLGLAGGAMQIAIQEALARHHGENSGVAITEGCIFAATGVFIGPVVISAAVEYGSGWRPAMFVPALALLPLLLAVPKNIPQQPHGSEHASAGPAVRPPRLSLIAWMMFFLIFLGIAAEWGIGFWGAQFLEEQLAITPAASVALMSVFFAGTIFGRIAVSRLLLRYAIDNILIWTIILGGAGMLLMWLVPVYAAAVTGLAIAGACLGNFFPLILSMATWQPPELLSKISAGATQAVGLALLLAPLVLGRMGESIGLVSATGALSAIPPVMLLVYLASRQLSNR